MEVSSAILAEWASIIASIATAILVVFVAWQIRLLRNEQNARLRPQIGIEKISNEPEPDGGEIKIILKNFGLTPAIQLRTKILASLGKQPTDEEIERIGYDVPLVVIPNQELRSSVYVTSDEYQGIHEQTDQSKMLYVSFKCEYLHTNEKKGYLDLTVRFERETHEIESFKSTL